MHRGLFVFLFGFGAAIFMDHGLGSDKTAFAGQEVKPEPSKAKRALQPRLLPGVQAGGAIQLPNQWSLRPAGRQVELGDFPVNIALHPDGRWIAVLHAGFGTHEIVIVDVAKGRNKVASRVTLEQTFYGLCFSPDGKILYASGGEFEVVHAYDFEDGLLFHHRAIPVSPIKDRFVVGGLAIDSAGKTLCVAGPWGDAVRLVPVDAPSEGITIRFDKESYPYTCLFDRAEKRVFVSLWNRSSIAVIHPEEKRVNATWETENHPTEMALSPDGKTLFVACANSTKVCALDAKNGQGLETIACSLYPGAPAGNTPSSLSLTPEGLLFVANADANNLAVFNVAETGKAKPLGFIPVGWYPTCVRFSPANKRLYVANGKGTMSLANPQGPNPLRRTIQSIEQYIAGLFRGTLEIIDLPSSARMAEYSKQAYACSPLRADERVSAEPVE